MNKLIISGKHKINFFLKIKINNVKKLCDYFFQIFEGMKAYRGQDGVIRMFRPRMNMIRMNLSAKRSGLPTFDGKELIKCLDKLIELDQHWVPHTESTSLYIRPTMIGIDVSFLQSFKQSKVSFFIYTYVYFQFYK